MQVFSSHALERKSCSQLEPVRLQLASYTPSCKNHFSLKFENKSLFSNYHLCKILFMLALKDADSYSWILQLTPDNSNPR